MQTIFLFMCLNIYIHFNDNKVKARKGKILESSNYFPKNFFHSIPFFSTFFFLPFQPTHIQKYKWTLIFWWKSFGKDLIFLLWKKAILIYVPLHSKDAVIFACIYHHIIHSMEKFFIVGFLEIFLEIFEFSMKIFKLSQMKKNNCFIWYSNLKKKKKKNWFI